MSIDPTGFLISVVYLSSVVGNFPMQDLNELLQLARKKNETLGITGMLLYKDRNFMQVLEGPDQNVSALLNTIKVDPRHSGVLVLRKKLIDQRDFGRWFMALGTQVGIAQELEDDLSDFLSHPIVSAMPDVSSIVYKLMLNFRRAANLS